MAAPLFETERLDVFHIEVCQPNCNGCEVYIAFEKDPDLPVWPICYASVVSGHEVEWIETPHEVRKGYATELLNGIASYIGEPMSGCVEVLPELFDAHRRWWRETHQSGESGSGE